MTVKIENASPDNVFDILKIENECFSTPWSESSIRDSLENKSSHFYLALLDGVTAGYIGVQIFSGEGYVTNIAVLPEFRRKGVAKALINRTLENEMEFLTLEVRESNAAAISLYEKLGFRIAGKRPRFYRKPDEDAILMTKYFEE